MPRQPRLILPSVAVHIVQRGNNRNACFADRGDYLLYLVHLHELSARYDCSVHAYCLMTNHVHLLLTPSSTEAAIGLMRDLGQRYVQYFNRRHNRTGTLWEGRFRSCVAESARYVLACYRYVELNPVRAGLAAHPIAYPWSSHGGNAGYRHDQLVSPHAEYIALGVDLASRHSSYKGLFDEVLGDSVLTDIRAATNGGYPLGSDHFKANIAASGRKVERGRAGRPAKDIKETRQQKIGL